MIITGNTTIIGNLTGNTGNTGNQPQPATRPAFITPRADTSTWTYYTKGGGLSPDWVITKGTQDSSFAATAYSLLSPWEIQHDIPDAGDMLLFSGRIRIEGRIYNNAQAGKDIAEVRLFIPDGETTYSCPSATPDKPYLVAGFILRYTNNCKIAMYLLDSSIDDDPLEYLNDSSSFDVEMLMRGGGVDFFCEGRYSRYVFFHRTPIKTPENKLCISSGANPLDKVSLRSFGSVAVREIITHTLTPEDDGVTFYSFYGCESNIRITIPDTPFPQGFSVNIINENGASMFALSGSNNVSLTGNDSKLTNSVDLAKGRFKLIQTGIDGKTWAMV
ncbi:hypothetical protein RJV04_000748 [Salmonella enterica]|nr:hypothetical protein [Salmonella enterica]